MNMTTDAEPMDSGPLGKDKLKPAQDDAAVAQKKLVQQFKQEIEKCKQYRMKLSADWRNSIDYRRGKPFASQTDEDRIVVNMDWSLTKAKTASLFSQVPQVRVSHFPQTQQAGPWVAKYEQQINDTLITAGIESAMEEVMADVINAAGIGAVIVSHEALTKDEMLPVQDLSGFPPELQQQILSTQMMPDGSPLEVQSVPRVLDHRYKVDRISPSDLLWPTGFARSDWDQAPWIGNSGRERWENAKRLFNLSDDQKQACVSTSDKPIQERLTDDADRARSIVEEVAYDQIFYKVYQYDATATSYYTIRRIVFVKGIEEPVIHEDWKGQKMDPQSNNLIGSYKVPIRVLTLTYITDEAIPPSDSAIGRPQVNEIIKSRTQMILQRERSLPVRWFNVDRVDPAIQQNLMRGTWQAMIPVQGDGSRVIGEVARAVMPNEDFAFDKIAKQDLSDAWQIGPNQQSGYGPSRTSASEANLIESNYQTRVGKERARVAKFYIGIAEVLGGLICLFEDPQNFGQGFTPEVSKSLAYSILADSTVLLDAEQRLAKLMKFIDMTAKSGWVDIGPVIREIAQLSGVDPNTVVRPPSPQPPEQPSISLRLTGIEDLMNPLAVAMLMNSGQAPKPELIEQAKALIQLATVPPAGQGPAVGGPVGLPPNPPAPPPPAPGDANPDMELLNRINQRTTDGRPNA